MIDWKKIVTNALSLLVASMFVGAAAIVWNGATTVGDKVTASEIKITSAISVLSEEIAINSDEIYNLYDLLEEHGLAVHNSQPIDIDGNEINEESVPPPIQNNARRDIKQSSIEEKIEQSYNNKSIK